jgi:hypothetical protein
MDRRNRLTPGIGSTLVLGAARPGTATGAASDSSPSAVSSTGPPGGGRGGPGASLARS